MEITAENRHPQRFARLEQDTGRPELDFDRHDFAGAQLDLPLVLQNRLVRRRALFVEFAMGHAQPPIGNRAMVEAAL